MINWKREDAKALMPLVFSLVLIVGMVLGFNLRDTLRSKRDINTVIARNDRLEQIVDLINEKYVDSINTDNLYKDAISGILKSLDPHTVYIPAEKLQDANDDLEGGFSGIGVEFTIIRDTIVVTSVIANGPASQAGVNTGDQFLKVGDSLVAGVNITSSRITHLLKGKQRTKVTVELRHIYPSTVSKLTITRDMIPLVSIDAGIMLKGNTGFIKVNRFSATTYKEFLATLKKLKKAGASDLILDLRDNPGGYLSQATAVADEFIEGEKLLVYTAGSHASKTEYKAEKKGTFETGRLVVLIDEGSAPASEILAGAIQDWDRGVIIGKRSFGKGLVQEPYDMTDGSEIRLTIAKYYTPSGRCIQRSFANGKEAYAAAYEKRFEADQLTHDEFVLQDTTRFYTAAHRTVYGGGGIKPDVYIPYDSVRLSHPLLSALYSSALKTVLWDYILNNKKELRYKNITDFERSFTGEKQVISNYLSTLNKKGSRALLKELSNKDINRYFRTNIKAQVARFLFGDNGYYAITLKEDNVVGKALEIIRSEEYSTVISGQGR
ncbi:MAG: S41 family peptidase [Taibaiella sp.]|nr:S41 family peptidase [Taibaiella sp.]